METKRAHIGNIVIIYCLIGLALITVISVTTVWADGNESTVLRNDHGIVRIPSKDHQPAQALTVPESNTMTGFAIAIVLNGLGFAGSRYYLLRRYNRDSAKRFASRQAMRLPLFVDTTLSVVVVLTVSPLLLAVALAGALKTGAPKVYRCTRPLAATNNNELADTETI